MMSHHLVVGLGLLYSCLMASAKTPAFPLPLAGVLLRPQHDRLRSVGSVDAVEGLVQGPCLAVLVCRHVEEVLLHWALGRDAHDDHACLFVLVARPEDPPQHAFGRLHQRGGGVGGREDPRLLEVPILAEVFPEGIGMEKYPPPPRPRCAAPSVSPHTVPHSWPRVCSACRGPPPSRRSSCSCRCSSSSHTPRSARSPCR